MSNGKATGQVGLHAGILILKLGLGDEAWEILYDIYSIVSTGWTSGEVLQE